MPLAIEDYALIGDCLTAALVGRDGSIDWLCLPSFDSGACFAALLGTPEHGRWQIAPARALTRVHRHYRDATLILETEFETADGCVRLVDFMAMHGGGSELIRIVHGVRGRVPMQMELVIRFDYGSIVPWVRQVGDRLQATAGPDTLELCTQVRTRGEGMKTVAEFDVSAGQVVPFVLQHRLSHAPMQEPREAAQALHDTEHWWRAWSARSRYRGSWRTEVQRSLITLKALTYGPTGGVVAAPTTSLPEQPGGVRNWDYRFCWLRDATFTLNAMLSSGYTDEAVQWREWLLRAVAGSPSDLQVLYSVTGTRRLDEVELSWLPGHFGAAPVRIGNAATRQFQLDIYGEVIDMLHLAAAAGLPAAPHAWDIQRALLDFLTVHWHDPDEGIWEVRGPRRHFVHSKVMAWVAFDRAVKAVDQLGLEGPVDEWRRTRDAIHRDVCTRGYDTTRASFVQHYETADLDASTLLIPLVGFLPPADPRVRATIVAIERELVVDGLVQRYRTASGVDHLPPGEGVFLPCSFWLACGLSLVGRRAEAEALFERLLALCNDVGLLSEEFDPASGHMRGNFPQALTHMALINTARLLSLSPEQAQRASERGERPATAEHAP